MSSKEKINQANNLVVLPVSPYEKADIDEGHSEIPSSLGVLPLRSTVVYPHMVAPLMVGRSSSVKLIKDTNKSDSLIALVAQREPDTENPKPKDLFQVGTVGKIVKALQFPNGVMQVWVHGIARVRLTEFLESKTPYMMAKIDVLSDQIESDTELEALERNIHDLLGKIASLSKEVPEDLTMMARGMDASAASDMIAMYLNIALEQKQKLLETTNVKERLSTLGSVLTRELSVLELSDKIQSEANEEMNKAQKEFYLRKQLGAIRNQLGEDDEATELKELEEQN